MKKEEFELLIEVTASILQRSPHVCRPANCFSFPDCLGVLPAENLQEKTPHGGKVILNILDVQFQVWDHLVMLIVLIR